MAAAFDPYHRWLGIPPSEQPPDHYRLLGLARYEADPEVIENAANQRMAHLRSFQTSRHAAESQKLLNEVATARVCLLNVDKKADYDQSLGQAETPTLAAAIALPTAPGAPLQPPTAVSTPPPVPRAPHIEVKSADSHLRGHRDPRARSRYPRAVRLALGGTLAALGLVIAIALSTRESRISTAVVVLELAGADRGDVAFSIDGIEQKLPSSDPLQFRCEPGPHELIAVRRGYPPFTANITLKARERLTIRPVWGPPTAAPPALVETTDTAPVENGARSESDPAVPPSPSTEAVTSQGTAAASGNSSSGEAQMSPPETDPSSIGPAETLAEQTATLCQMAQSATDADVIRSLLAAADGVLDAAAAANRHDLASQLLAAFLAEVGRKPSWRPFEPRITQRQAFQRALADLETRPDDPSANAVAGRWYMVDASAPDKAFPYIARMQHATLSSLARSELSPPASADEQTALGDRWWDQAESATDSSLKEAFRNRAVHWYKQARPNLTSMLLIAKIDSRIGQSSESSPPAADGQGTSSHLPEGPVITKGRWVDLLETVNPARDVIRGLWRRQGMTIATAAPGSALMLPVAVSGDYELEFQFSLINGPPEGLSITLPVGSHACNVLLPFNERTDVLHDINGQPHSTPVSRLEPGRLLLARFRVATVDSQKQISVLINGGPYFQWQGDESLFSCSERGRLPRMNQPGLINHQETFAFQAIRFQLLEGEARRITSAGLPPRPYLLTGEVGGFQGTVFEDFAPKGAVLAGLRYASGGFGLGGLQPIYRTGDGQVAEGTWVGAAAQPNNSIVAREGYAVGALVFETQNRSLAGVTVRFYRLDAGGLDLGDTYDSPLIGLAGVDGPALVETRGRPAIGVHGLWNPGQIVSLGLVSARPEEETLWKTAEDGRGQYLTLLDLEPAQCAVAEQDYSKRLGVGTAEPSRWPILAADSQFCPESLYAPAPSRLTWKLPSTIKSFSAVGYCAESRSVLFRVLVDGQSVYQSQQAGVVPIKIDLPPGEQLELQVDEMANGRDDESYWLFPRVHARPASALKAFDEKDARSKQLVQITPLTQVIAPRNAAQKRLAPVYPADCPCHEFLYAHPPSRIVYQVPKGAKRFSAIGYCIDGKTVRFRVSVNGNVVHQSGPAGTEKIQFSLQRQAETVELWIDPSSEGQVRPEDVAFWCFPRFTR